MTKQPGDGSRANAIFLIFLALARFKNSLTLPVLLIGGIAGVHAVLLALGVSTEEARAQGWLFSARSSGPLWFPWNTAEIAQIDWAILAEGAGGLVVLMVVTSISILLKALIIRVLAARLNFANGLIGALQRS